MFGRSGYVGFWVSVLRLLSCDFEEFRFRHLNCMRVDLQEHWNLGAKGGDLGL